MAPVRFFPIILQILLRLLANLKGLDVLVAYQQLLQHADAAVRLRAAQAWSLWEARVATLLPNTSMRQGAIEPDSALPLARIENHYFLHHCFLRPNQLMAELGAVQHLPCHIVHGRYDMVCKLENAATLHQAWPGSVLSIVSNAGHSASETGISRALYDASVQLAVHLRGAK